MKTPSYKRNIKLVVSGLVFTMLAACGGGSNNRDANGSGGAISSPVDISGRVADGYINGAIVFWDCNDNLTLDIGEINVQSGKNGTFTIPIAPVTSCKLRAEIPSTAIDEDTNSPIGKSMTLAAVDGHPEFISPLTTLAALGIATESQLAAKFLGSNTLSVTENYVKAGITGIPSHNAAKYTAIAMQAVGGNIKTPDNETRKQLLTQAFLTIPTEAWVNTTPVDQTALDNFTRDMPKLSALNLLSDSSSSIEFALNESAFNGPDDPRRPVVQKALDGLKAYPYIVVGSNIRWRALPDSVLTSFGPSLADKTLFPATSEETLIRDKIFDALNLAQAENSAALSKFNRSLGATFLKNAVDMSLTSVNSAITLVPVAGYAIKSLKFKSIVTKLKKASKVSREAAEALPDFINVVQECGNLSNDLAYLSALPDQIAISELKDPAVDLMKCVTGLMGSKKVRAVIDGIALGKTTSDAAQNGDIIKLLKGLSDVISVSLDLAGLSVPAAIYNESFGMVITAINSIVEINLAADEQDAKFQEALKDISRKLNVILARDGEILIATRLAPYITTLGSQPTLSPTSAIVGTVTTFTIRGLSSTVGQLITAFNGCADIQFISQSASQRQFTCRPNTVGILTAEIRTSFDAAPLASFAVTVSANPVICSQSQLLSGGVCINAPTATMPVSGTNPTSGSNSSPVTTCTLPQVLFDGVCVTASITCTSPLVLSNGVCVSLVVASVNIAATSFVNGVNVALSANGYGVDTLMNAPPYGTAANAAEWIINIPPGRYELFATYASALSRPVTISFNGTTVFTNALAATTGGFFPANRQTLSQGVVQLPTGASIMRVSRGDVFPHIKGFTLVPVN